MPTFRTQKVEQWAKIGKEKTRCKKGKAGETAEKQNNELTDSSSNTLITEMSSLGYVCDGLPIQRSFEGVVLTKYIVIVRCWI